MNKVKRNQHNQDIIRRMKLGDDLMSGSADDSFWPNRSKGFIKKDKDAIEKLYNSKKPRAALLVVQKET